MEPQQLAETIVAQIKADTSPDLDTYAGPWRLVNLRIVQDIVDRSRDVITDNPTLSVETIVQAALLAYDMIVGPIDLPGPDTFLDNLAKQLLEKIIRKIWARHQPQTA